MSREERAAARYRDMFKESDCTEYLDYICVDEMGSYFVSTMLPTILSRF